MNLSEWKLGKTAQLREQVKQQLREDAVISEHFLFSEEELQEIQDEVLIESFSELYEDWEVVSLDEDELEESTELQEFFDFIPSPTGKETDIEAEVDLDVYSVNEEIVQKIAEIFFAEDYEIITESSKAIIIFKRSKGEVFKKKKCGKGMRLVGNKCLPQTGTQKAEERRRGIKLKRAFRALGAGKKKKAQIKKKITQRRIKGRARNLANTVN